MLRLLTSSTYVSWYHTTRISRNTVCFVAKQHSNSLKSLQIYNNPRGLDFFQPNFSALDRLDACDLDPCHDAAWVAELMIRNKKSLSYLKLGSEKATALSYMGRRGTIQGKGNLRLTARLIKLVRIMLKGAFNEDGIGNGDVITQDPILAPKLLHLVDFDCPQIFEATTQPLFNFDSITSLCLESCSQFNTSFLELFTQPQGCSIWEPRLKTFRLRFESNVNVQEALKAFFLAFTGLEHLSLLLEGSNISNLSPEWFIKNHGATLQTLVWDQRSGQRTFMSATTTLGLEKPLGQGPTLSKISQGCPNLIELGLAMIVRDYWEFDPVS